MKRTTKVWRPRIATAILAAIVTSSAGAQVPRGETPSTNWVVARDAAVDLWFHSLAILELTGPGSLPFYDTAYVRAIADAKRMRGIGPTRLDHDARRLHAVLTADSAFEVLHFIPLYFGRLAPEKLPGLLRRVAGTASAESGEQAELAASLRSALSTREQRAALLQLADGIEDEWRTFFAGYYATRATTDAARVRELQADWDGGFAPSFAGFLRTMHATRGVLLVSPALGREGRVVRLGEGEGEGEGPGAGIVVAVGTASDAGVPDAPILAAVRELCFPLLDQIGATVSGATGPSVFAADASSRAAVQCGAVLFDAAIPAVAGNYRSLFLRKYPNESPPQFRRRFDGRFRADAATMRAVSGVIARTNARGAGASP